MGREAGHYLKTVADRGTAGVSTATFIVAAHDSLHPERADYVCDGTDDQVQIQAAIDALPSGGGKILLLEGTYNSDQIIISSNTIFSGVGPSTILKLKDGANDRFIINSDRTSGNSNIGVENIYIDGNKDGQTAIGTTDGFGNAGCVDFHKVTNLTVKNCVIINGWAAGIETTQCSYVIITGNMIDNSADDGIGINDQSFYVTVSNNIVTDAGQGKSYGSPHGIEIQDGSHDFNVIGNVVKNADGNGVYINSHSGGGTIYNGTVSNNNIISCVGPAIGISCPSGSITRDISIIGNTLFDCTNAIYVAGVSGYNVHDISIIGNIADGNDAQYYGIRIKNYSDKCTICNNVAVGMTGSGVSADGSNLTICNNVLTDNADCGVNLQINSNNCYTSGNILKDNTNNNYYDVGTSNRSYEKHLDLLMDVLAVSATHVRSNEDLSAATPITFTIDAQPDVPRTLSWSFDSHAQITEYDMEVIGMDAKGNAVTETWDETAGWSGETSNTFATITSIKMTSRTGTGAADTMDLGITDVLGLSNVIYATSDVFKIKKNNANATVATAQVNTTYDTYDMSVITLGAADDFTIWYKSNLNIIS